jgi:hypothetical protein
MTIPSGVLQCTEYFGSSQTIRPGWACPCEHSQTAYAIAPTTPSPTSHQVVYVSVSVSITAQKGSAHKAVCHGRRRVTPIVRPCRWSGRCQPCVRSRHHLSQAVAVARPSLYTQCRLAPWSRSEASLRGHAP